MDEIKRYEPPIDDSLLDRLCAGWEAEFKSTYDAFRRCLAGEEPENQFVLRVAWLGDEIAGTCQITTCGVDSTLGGVGEVFTPQRFRGRGIGGKIFRQACEEFFDKGGQALFLGTENPQAARIYHRYGFRRIPATENMGCVQQGIAEDFLHEYAATISPSREVITLSPHHRILLIPFIMAPHEMMVLDRHARYVSVRQQRLHGCMSLYGRFAKVQQQGEVFVCVSSNQRMVALASVVSRGDRAEIDGCALPGGLEDGTRTIQAAIAWAESHDLAPAFQVAVEDDVKTRWLQDLGVRFESSNRVVQLDGREVPCLVGEFAQ